MLWADDYEVRSFALEGDGTVVDSRVDVGRSVSVARLLGDGVLRYSGYAIDLTPRTRAADPAAVATLELDGLYAAATACNFAGWAGQVLAHGQPSPLAAAPCSPATAASRSSTPAATGRPS